VNVDQKVIRTPNCICRAEVTVERMRRLTGVVERSALARHEAKGKLMFSFESGLLAAHGGGKTRG